MIADSTCMICLSKIKKVELLKKVFRSVAIPRAVKNEILIEGKEGLQDIQNALNEGWLKIRNAKRVMNLGLGEGENEALSLAHERKETLILDDAYALKAARALHIDTIRTTSIIFIAVKKKIIDKEESIAILNKLIENGYYISPAAYAAILTKLKEK